MQTPPTRPEHRFGFAFITLARQWRHNIEKCLHEAGLTDATWAPLVHLARAGGGIRQTDLAARVGLDTSTLVRLLDLLEARGLIERRIDPGDRRARQLFLTPAGDREVANIQARIWSAEEAFLSDLSAPDIDSMLGHFDTIAARLSRSETQAPEKVEAP